MPDKIGMKATQNGVTKDGDTVTVTTPYNGDSTKIKVECKRTVTYTLAQILGSNNTTVTASAVAQKTTGGGGSNGSAAFGYALFSGDKTPSGALTMSGNSNITGNVHTNSSCTMSGNGTINGSVEAVSTFTASGNCSISNICQASSVSKGKNCYIGTIIQSPAPFVAMPDDFSDIIKSEADAAGTMSKQNKNISGNTTVSSPIYIKGDLTISGNTTMTFTSPIYVDGNITISGNYSYPGSCIFATGYITLSGNNNSTNNKVLIYSQKKDITISGNSAPSGVVFAPKGRITISGNSVHGRVIANTVTLSGNYDITSGSDDLKCLPGEDSIKLVN